MTRKEAIERIKARFDKWALDDDDMKAIQTLIPELRESESEDERVRKALIDLVCTVGEYYLPKLEARNKMLDYLEKQKEQKPCWNPTEEDVALFNKAITTNASLSPQERAKLDIIRMKFKHRPVIEQKEQNGEDEECTDFTIYYPLKNEKGEYECIPYSFYDSLTFFSEDKDLIDFHRACFYTEEECNEWIEQQKEQKSVDYDHEMWKNCEANFEGGKKEVIEHPEKYGLQKPAEWSEEDEEKIVTISEIIEHCTTIPYSGGTLTLNKEYKKELLCFIKSLRPQYHGDVTMTEAYKMGLEAGKASSWKPSEEQTNNVIVELTRIELGDIINGLYYLKEKYYEDCKEHNGTATVGLSDEFKFYFKRFNEALDLYTRLHELEKQTYETTTDGYYYE